MTKRGQNEQSKKNLEKGKQFTSEYQPSSEAKSKGKQKKIQMRQMLEYLLAKEIKNNQGEMATTLEAISVTLIKQAMSGNVKAFEVIRDTIGQNPTHKMDLQNIGFNVTVADEKHKRMLEEL